MWVAVLALLCCTAYAQQEVEVTGADGAAVRTEGKTIKRKVAIERFSNETQYGKGIFYDKENDPMGKQALDILSAKLAASGKFILRSTTSGEVLYRREGNLTVDTDLSADEDDSPLEVLLGMAATMLTTSLTDQVVAGRRCTDAVLSDMPLGKYSPAYGTDREVKAGKSYFEATVK